METFVVYSVGKTKEVWLHQGCEEYIKRLKNRVKIEFVWCKDDQQLAALVQKEPVAIALDMRGQMVTSEEFSKKILSFMQRGKNRIAMVIGGAEGLPEVLRTSLPLISFSAMTFTHQMMRLLLLEQLYRAYEIIRGSPYHK
jgi:23S rRNA (pseudouridine1915-N3)-methyltransferase